MLASIGHSSPRSKFLSCLSHSSLSLLLPFSCLVKDRVKLTEHRSDHFRLGQNRVELLTPALSERCSNQLSYCPNKTKGERKKKDENNLNSVLRSLCRTPTLVLPYRTYLSLRKEVIQPHFPVRLPCYDFTPLTKHTFDSALLAVEPLASGILYSDGVTGGVYKARERIHRTVLMCDY